MFDHADGAVEGFGGVFRGESGLRQIAVQDVVLAVGDVRLAAFFDAQLGREALVAEAAGGGLPSKGDDFDGDGEDRSQGGDQLGQQRRPAQQPHDDRVRMP